MTYIAANPDALAQAIRIVDGNHDLGAAALADALLASGAVVDAGTLADDEALVKTVFRNSTLLTRREVRVVLRTLAAALAERSQP